MLQGDPKARAVGRFPKGGEAMSVYEVLMIVFGAVSIVIALVRLSIYVSDKFSLKRK